MLGADRGRPPLARLSHWIAKHLELRSRTWSVAVLPPHARGGFDCLETVELLLRYHKPVCVADVGAWRARWTSALLHRATTVRDVTLFEPQPAAAANLVGMRFPCRTRVVQKALSDRQGLRTLYAGSASASLLQPGGLCEHFPAAVPHQHVQVECDTLDALVARGEVPQPDTVKLDVQGGELDVIHGARHTLSGVRALLLELSWQPLYREEPAPEAILAELRAQGFRVVDTTSGLRDRTGALLQQDILFLRMG